MASRNRQGQLNWPTVQPARVPVPGMHALGINSPTKNRDGYFFVPASAKAEIPMPLAICFHGAGGDGKGALSLFREQAEERGILLLAPDSREHTWDLLIGGFGPDVEFLNRALEVVCRAAPIDPDRVAISGFSDGASYALTLGIANGRLFSHIIAFSPGFAIPELAQDSPKIFISHGTQDRVLSIERCSRVIVPRLRRAGLDVVYREFEGPHTVPLDIANEAVEWFLGSRADVP